MKKAISIFFIFIFLSISNSCTSQTLSSSTITTSNDTTTLTTNIEELPFSYYQIPNETVEDKILIQIYPISSEYFLFEYENYEFVLYNLLTMDIENIILDSYGEYDLLYNSIENYFIAVFEVEDSYFSVSSAGIIHHTKISNEDSSEIRILNNNSFAIIGYQNSEIDDFTNAYKYSLTYIYSITDGYLATTDKYPITNDLFITETSYSTTFYQWFNNEFIQVKTLNRKISTNYTINVDSSIIIETFFPNATYRELFYYDDQYKLHYGDILYADTISYSSTTKVIFGELEENIITCYDLYGELLISFELDVYLSDNVKIINDEYFSISKDNTATIYDYSYNEVERFEYSDSFNISTYGYNYIVKVDSNTYLWDINEDLLIEVDGFAGIIDNNTVFYTEESDLEFFNYNNDTKEISYSDVTINFDISNNIIFTDLSNLLFIELIQDNLDNQTCNLYYNNDLVLSGELIMYPNLNFFIFRSSDSYYYAYIDSKLSSFYKY